MAGRGPAPKPAERRVRRRNDGAAVLPLVHGKQPALPKRMPDRQVYDFATGEHHTVPGGPWPSQTKSWWRRWAASPLTESFTDLDWSELLDAAILHGRLWSFGDVKVMPELRLRVAKFGATPEDRARLRIQLVQADEADAKRSAPAADRWAKLRVVE